MPSQSVAGQGLISGRLKIGLEAQAGADHVHPKPVTVQRTNAFLQPSHVGRLQSSTRLPSRKSYGLRCGLQRLSMAQS